MPFCPNYLNGKLAELFHFHRTFLHISQTISSAAHNKSVLP
ncbi:hypothetical protein PI172_0337 [Prevotella intermedia]|uniref:Uncharacterized protein n=1 Tax=Prevotella intermedia TaxID=28131 RepID=A0AAD1BGS4_PREIN|nr:hypothetical protein PI172_0337 [Prevotella intermedia]